MWEIVGLALVAVPAAFYATRIEDVAVRSELLWGLFSAAVALLLTVSVVPTACQYLLRRGLKGKDRGKMGRKDGAGERDIPSALGLVCGGVYMIIIVLTQLVYAKSDAVLLGNYNAALLSICFMVLLGFADDVLDLPWRYKLLLPTIASLPLLVSYSGVTSVLMPKQVRWLLVDAGTKELTFIGQLADRLVTVDTNALGAIVDLGAWYYVYMGMLAVFSTNTINIYAGINGLEAGQSLIIGIAILTANVYELSLGAGMASPHLFSAMLALPFIATTLGLMYFNMYPATIFVGDTYCYFAGMTVAVMAILGHFSKTLLLFFIPQILNFVMSVPQLFKVYPCPRHRMPDYDPESDKLVPSTFEMHPRRDDSDDDATVAAIAAAGASPAGSGAAPAGAKGKKAAAPAGNADVTSASAVASGAASGAANGEKGVQYTNFTLINLCLRLFGPMHERTTVNVLLAFQVLCCAVGMLVRYNVSELVYAGARDGLLAAGGAAPAVAPGAAPPISA